MDMASDKQQLLTKKIREFASNTRPRSVSMEEKKNNIHNSALALFEGRKMVFNAFRSGKFSIPLGDSKEKSKESDDNDKTINKSILTSSSSSS